MALEMHSNTFVWGGIAVMYFLGMALQTLSESIFWNWFCGRAFRMGFDISVGGLFLKCVMGVKMIIGMVFG